MADSSDRARMFDDWERDAVDKAARFKEMAEQVEQVEITESVAGGSIRVTVDHNGLLTDISMTDGVRWMEPAEIASGVMAAIRKAQSRYPGLLAKILADTVGSDDPAARHILARAEETFPPDPDLAEPTEPMVFDDVEAGRAPRPRPAPARQARS
jgi:DNA-binding protein YbaB